MFVMLVAALMTATPAPGARGVVTARALIDEFQFAKALSVIGEALREPGLESATLINLYELEGIANATSGASSAAKDSFVRLLTLDPQHPMPNELPPKVRTIYFGARGVAVREPLELGALTPTRVGRFIEALEVTVKQSSVLPATAVRFKVSLDEAAPFITVVPLDGARKPSLKVHGAHVKWSAELLGARDAVLRVVSREELAPPVDEPRAAPPLAVTAPPPAAGGWVRPAGVVLGVGGVVALGIGIGLGVESAEARRKLESVQPDDQGVVVAFTQAEAARLDSAATSGAVAANVLMIAGGVGTAVGVLMFALGGSESSGPQASLSVGPGGLTVSGQF